MVVEVLLWVAEVVVVSFEGTVDEVVDAVFVWLARQADKDNTVSKHITIANIFFIHITSRIV